jgi:hypothetical protein
MPRFTQLLTGILLVYSPAASAIGWKTQMNCASDYYAYCSNFAVGSTDVRRCMRSNGPRLSKACVEALIADGEISKSEVGRIKQAAGSAKVRVKADPKKLVANPQSPKPNDNLRTTLSIEPVRAPVPVQLVINDRTIAALRNRTHLLEAGEVLLAREAGEGNKTDETPSPVEPLTNGPSIANETRSVEKLKDRPATQTPKNNGSSPSENPKDPQPAVTQRTQVAGEPSASSRPAASPPGKMSLGRNSSTEAANGPDPAVEWDTYMQNRFNGGMNYEGLGARFSKEP